MTVLSFRFDVDESEFFTTNVRGRVVDFILSRKRYSDDEFDDFAFGMHRLLKDGALTAAYPLHDVSSIKLLNTN